MTCSKVYKQVFTEKKAKAVLKNIPKKLRKFNFQVVDIGEQSENDELKTEEIPKQELQEAPKILEKDSPPEPIEPKKRTIESSDYVPGENITRWIEKFGLCEEVLNEAKIRLGDLKVKQVVADKKTIDILHNIELGRDLDLYHGWLLYKQLKEIRKERRQIKDEILVLEAIVGHVDIAAMQKKRVKKQIEGLSKRKYSFRIIEDEAENT